ncbi:hypothetical protein BKH46_05780 [Helicobacter sp. 12S02634-8]|uniref:catalase n=1 Tax=Helicobacter sp. 12S02634-8 TaxID=1476199 RepID=UPI000BD72C89|nr:catalase [Helicobacter sp. 12S02634-8]PAF46945.1 hypothetical protein BKH46_05780 [Helicobacter sp. 12S02634-8]
MGIKYAYIWALLGVLALGLGAKEALTPTDGADFFYQRFGDKNQPHKKINHTKGFCASGYFEPRKDIRSFVKIPLLEAKSKVLARYSIGGGNPYVSDRTNPHGLALKITDGKEEWDFAMLNTQINAGKTPELILEFLSLAADPSKKDKLKELAHQHKSVQHFMDYSRSLGVPLSLANVAFHTQHVYGITQNDGSVMHAKIVFAPQAGVIERSSQEAQKSGDNFLEKRFQEDLKKGSVRYHMYLIVAKPDDVIDDISVFWGSDNRKIFLGTLVLDRFEGQGCEGDVFLPKVLPLGVKAPIDPVFEFRNQVYTITHQRRQ